MPFIYAHNVCAARAFDILAESGEIIGQNRRFFDLGAQGPDIWFYHRAAPFWFGRTLRPFGTSLHNLAVKETFLAMLESVRHARAGLKAQAFAYLAGYITHYSLDTAAHPYVLYWCGQRRYHTLFERDIDIALLNEFGPGIKAVKLTHFLPDVPEAPLRLLYSAASPLHGGFELSAEDVRRAIRDCRACAAVMYDPRGIKTAVCSALERCVGKRGAMTQVLYSPKLSKPGIDPLNQRNAVWQPPWSGDVKNTGFMDILANAGRAASSRIEAAFLAAFCGGPSDRALELIGDNSFLTGENWRMPLLESCLHTNCVYA